MGDDFKAGKIHAGEICHQCDVPIKEDDDVRYYGGPYVMHSACIDKLIKNA